MDRPAIAPTEHTIHLVFSSHWDREWYQPFQKFREKLVRVLDGVLAHLESGALPFYQMDGQFIPIEDYVEIRPEKEALIRSLIRDGRLRVGPWYNLPDSFLVSGESLVRNFLLGMKRAQAWGGTSEIGWLCDIFGHNSQTPQILDQLGIDNAILWRGVPMELGALFHWSAPDGSTVLVSRLPVDGYCDFNFVVRRQHERSAQPTVEEMVKRATDYLAQISATSPTRNLLWFDGGDHLEFNPIVLDFARAFNAQSGREVIKVSTLDTFIKSVQAEAIPGLPSYTGELREAASYETRGWLIPGVGSSRVPLKQANHAGETLLTLWSEPWCGAAHLALGLEYPARALELAWEYLLKNHPHDSICGCSTDETHRAMPYRFDQSRQIAEVHLDRALVHLGAAALRPQMKEGEMGLNLFTSAGGEAQPCPEAYLRLPKDWPQFKEYFGFESLPSFRLYDFAGKEVAYQLLAVDPSTSHRVEPPDHMPTSEQRQGVRIAVDTTLKPNEQCHFVIRRDTKATRIAQEGTIGIARDTLRNEFLEVKASRDGTLALKDLATGAEFSGLLALEDTADIGDGWFHGIAKQDRAYLSTGGNVTYGLHENGPLVASVAIRVEWLVPREFDFRAMRRSEQLAPLVVEHVVTLRKGSPRVDIVTTVHNQVRDHRLRLFCPSGFGGAKTYWSDTPFDAVERNVGVRADAHLLREWPAEMTPQQNWVAVANDRAGLALLAPGQYESAVLDQPDRPLCVTLLRGFRKAVFTDGNDGGQIIGDHTFPLSLVPFRPPAPGQAPAALLQRTAQDIAASCRSFYFDTADLAEISTPAEATGQAAPRVTGDVVVSASHPSGPGQWTLRVYNPAAQSTTVNLIGGSNWTRANLRGDNVTAISTRSCEIPAKRIVTFNVNL